MSASPQAAPGGWLIGPKADLLFIANLTWPLFAFLLWLNPGPDTWLALYLTSVIGTPHRWLTLGIVGVDAERMANRWRTLLAVGLGTALFFGALWGWTRNVALLVLVRYLWNVWHVAAQHAGVARIYGIRCQPERRSSGAMEKHALRLFIVYAFLRAASLGGVFDNWRWLLVWVQRFSLSDGRLDGLALLVPAGILLREARSFDRRLTSRYVHLCSLLLNYGAMIVFCHLGMTRCALAISGATAVFHATEYFGFVAWWMGRRAQRPEGLLLPSLVRNWTASVLVFLHVMAASSILLASANAFLWVMANTLVSFLHYAYDAVLWKMPMVFPAKAPAYSSR